MNLLLLEPNLNDGPQMPSWRKVYISNTTGQTFVTVNRVDCFPSRSSQGNYLLLPSNMSINTKRKARHAAVSFPLVFLPKHSGVLWTASGQRSRKLDDIGYAQSDYNTRNIFFDYCFFSFNPMAKLCVVPATMKRQSVGYVCVLL